MTRVLLVEDYKSYDKEFWSAYGKANVTAVRSFEELRNVLLDGAEFDYAFLDFSLGERSKYTGLSCFAAVHAANPQTRTLALTDPTEASRPLFSVAAHRWFGMWGLMDKRQTDDQNLELVGSGHNPTPAAWRSALDKYAHLVDHLFAEPTWGQLWRSTGRANGVAVGYEAQIQWATKKIAQGFIDRASPAAVNFATAFHAPRGGLSDKPQLAMTGFHRENWRFLEAPDLLATLDLAQPWSRVASR